MAATVDLILRGLVVIFVSPDAKLCTIGLLKKTPPHHQFRITITKTMAGEEPQPFSEISESDIKEALSLDSQNTTLSGITRRNPNAKIDRATGPFGNEDSFAWVVDFERDFFGGKPMGAQKAGFRSILTVNNGELFTERISDNKLLIRKGNQGPFKDFGFVACETGIRIELDTVDSTASFRNGDDLIFKADAQTTYRVVFDHGAIGNHNHGGNDADFYYSAIGDLIPDSEKIFFSTTPLPKAMPGATITSTPDAACFNGGGGHSQMG